MKKILTSLIAATMLVPSGVLASSIRPGSRVTHQSLNSSSKSKTLCLNEKEKFAERCEVTIDETGVKGPAGHITNVVQWIKDCLLYTSPSPRDRQKSRMPSSA